MNFVTFYPQCHNAGLMKDVGQIPNVLGSLYPQINAKLVSCIVDLNDPNIKELTGMSIEKIRYPLHNDFLTGLIYILRNARRVDWFNFYHGGRKVYYWTRIYKMLNPHGKVYLKMDLSYDGCKKYGGSEKKTKIFNKVANSVDIISVESDAIRKKVAEFSKADVKVITNGYCHVNNFVVKKTSKRRKEFITVGRLGTPPKATDLLMTAFEKSSNFHDWNLRLVGLIDKTFVNFIDQFFIKYPKLKSRIFFDGPVTDKKKLYDLYNSARVFVLPSRYEGFPLVGPEASFCGCRMILTDSIPPIKELTNDGEFGVSIKTDDVQALTDALVNETKRNVDDQEPLSENIYAKENFSWNLICKNLMELMGYKV